MPPPAMTRPTALGPDGDLLAALRARMAAPGAGRITPLDHRGRRYWIKRVESLPLRWRLQKGNPARSFARERAALHNLAARGAPVPPILAEGEDWFALPDCGETLAAILRRPDPADRAEVFARAGAALARLHAMGLAHGRPQPRDLCWDGAQIRLLDFERAGEGRAPAWRRALDLVQTVHGIYALDLTAGPEVDAFCAGYRAEDRAGIWARAVRLCRRLSWLEPLTRPLQWMEARETGRTHAREWQAIRPALARLTTAG